MRNAERSPHAMSLDAPGRSAKPGNGAPDAGGLVELDPRDPRWTNLVAMHPDALPFHHPSWAHLLAESYGFRPFVLALPDGSTGVAGGLPFVEVKDPLRGRRWISLPFTDYCPPLVSGRAALNLAERLDEARRRSRIVRVEVRAQLEGHGSFLGASAVRHTLPLSPDPEAVARTFSRSQVRRNILRSEREGISIRRAESLRELTHSYYDLHVETRRRHGIPVQPLRFFSLLWQHVLEPGLGFLLLARAAGTPVAGAVFLAWNRTVTYKYGASNPDFWKLRPNHLLLFEAIRWSCERGFATFDFGRTDLSNQGLRDFKSGWGTREEPLIYSTVADRPPRASGEHLATLLGALMRRSPPWVARATGELFYKYAA